MSKTMQIFLLLQRARDARELAAIQTWRLCVGHEKLHHCLDNCFLKSYEFVYAIPRAR